MSFHWSLAPDRTEAARVLAAQANISPLLARCLLNRQVQEADAVARFLQPRLRHLSDPFLLPNMRVAVDRLFEARARQESLVIFGDYDVDGITSTALLFQVFQALGWRVKYYLPHRVDDGYGLSREGVERCLERCPATLLLAVDCGSTAVETIARLQQNGIDVVVLDHHQVASPPPPARALVNPRAGTGNEAPHAGNGCELEAKDLCSVGLAFKLAHALTKRGRELGLAEAFQLDLRQFLELVALGTIADLVPLTSENRLFATRGLERLNTTPHLGLQALKGVAQVLAPIHVPAVAFQLAPRLNAAGRLEDAAAALELLLTRDRAEADRLAQNLEGRNRERQAIERAMAEEVIRTVRAKFNPTTDFVIVEGKMPWHIGVVGIVASRVLRAFHRPTIIAGGDGESWRGSGRSIEGFDLAAALRDCSDLLLRHGGHALAAGVSLQAANLDALRVRLNALASQRLTAEQLRPTLRLDARVSLAELTVEQVAEFAGLEPIGHGNPPVQFAAHNLHCLQPPRRMGRDQRHLKMWLTDGAATLEAVGWGMGNSAVPAEPFDMAFLPRLNHYDGRDSVQLEVLDWRYSD